jgi:hypothetical protein
MAVAIGLHEPSTQMLPGLAKVSPRTAPEGEHAKVQHRQKTKPK